MSTRVAFYEQWRDLMRSWGYTVLEADGWRTRDAEPGTSYDPSQVYLEHHDASTHLSGNWGALAYILANRLANIVTARDGQIMLCAAGVEWHAGVGAYPGLPTNGANPRSMGNEVCNSGSEAYDPRCTSAIIAGEAAWCIVAGRGVDRVIGHKEWAKPDGRKTDPSVDMNQRRADVAAFIANPQGDDMSQEAEDRINDIHRLLGAGNARGVISPTNPADVPKTISYKVNDVQAALTKALPAMAGQLAAQTELLRQLADGEVSGGVDMAAIEAAAQRGTDAALADFEATVVVSHGDGA